RDLSLYRWEDDGYFMLVLPEFDPRAVLNLTRQVLCALETASPRAGYACCPTDGCNSDALWAAAVDGARAATVGEVLGASATATTLVFGERTILMADSSMKHIYELLRRVSVSDLPILISGETGAGKENAAFALHGWSLRASGPFVALNCAAVQDTLLESEL